MAKRVRRRGGATWWAIGITIVAAGLLVWWLSARRAEAPGLPASIPGARALSGEAPDLHGGEHEQEHGEITGDEKADLERIIRERGAPTAPK